MNTQAQAVVAAQAPPRAKQGWQTRVDVALREWLKTHSPV